MRYFDKAQVETMLTYPLCVDAVRRAMIALSAGETRQLLRSILPLAGDRLIGVMPGAMAADGVFGAKLISVTPDNPARGMSTHQGVIVLFDPASGLPTACVEAGAITGIRTAATSAAATAALANPDWRRLAILGAGEQAHAHALAIAGERPLERLTVWGRSPDRAEALARRLRAVLPCPIAVAFEAREAVRDADVICTVTSAASPILFSAWVKDGAHLNVVGSSHAGPIEIDNALVARARFVADYRPGVLAQGAEFLSAKAAGLVDDSHVVAELGEVLSGAAPGRTRADEVTLFKSLGHVVQDLAAAQVVVDRAGAD